MLRVLRYSLVVLLAGSLSASLGAHISTVVLPDRVLIGSANEFLPRRLDLTNKLVVAAGQTVELPAVSSYDYIEWSGTLRVSRTHDTLLRVTTAVGLPGAVLDVGTVADPIPCGVKVEIVIRDVPIDLTRDPVQWGNGLVNFGKQTRVGCEKTSFVEATASIAKGATSLTLATLPVGWTVGDELVFPDMAQPTVIPNQGTVTRRETTVTIATISGVNVTLSKALDFEHNVVLDPNGVQVLRPRVANLTRNILLHSENPNGTPGHTADIGMAAKWDIRYNQFVGLGRTKNLPLDDTTLDPSFNVIHVGTVQRGKYADHKHHPDSCPTCASIGNTYLSQGGPLASKWAYALHGASDTLVQDNVVVGFPGAGIVTEDGYEVRNILRHNAVAYATGDSQRGIDATIEIDRNCPGCDGGGFWFRGIVNTFEGNESWDNAVGFNLINIKQPAGLYPSKPGGPVDTAMNPHTAMPVSFNGLVLIGNLVTGLELWGDRPFPIQGLICANVGGRCVFAGSSDDISLDLRAPILISQVGAGDPQLGTVGIQSSDGYVVTCSIVGGQIAGFKFGMTEGCSEAGVIVTDTVWQNEVNIERILRTMHLTNTKTTPMFLPLPGKPHNFLQLSATGTNINGFVWSGVDPLPGEAVNMYRQARGSDIWAKNWQGTGQDFRFCLNQSDGPNPSYYSGPTDHVSDPPFKGQTNQMIWDTTGMGWNGCNLAPADALTLDGVLYGKAAKGITTPLGPPRVIVTFPTNREPAIVDSGSIRTYMVLTGDPTAASTQIWRSVDNGPARHVDTGSEVGGLDTRIDLVGDGEPNAVTQGAHTITAWRTTVANPTVKIAGSEFTSPYTVGAIQPPPTTCQDPKATNIGGPLPCMFPPPPPLTCQDPKATNVGGPLPCIFPLPPPVTGSPAFVYTCVVDTLNTIWCSAPVPVIKR